MAVTEAGKRLTQLHRRRQLALRAKVIREVMALWPAWQPKDPGSFKAFEDAMVLLVQSRSVQSAAIAADYLQRFRRVELTAVASKSVADAVERTFASLAKARSEEQIRTVVGASARGQVYKALQAGQSFEQAMANGAVRVSGDVSRLVMLGGSDTITNEARRSKLRFARVLGPNKFFLELLHGRSTEDDVLVRRGFPEGPDKVDPFRSGSVDRKPGKAG